MSIGIIGINPTEVSTTPGFTPGAVGAIEDSSGTRGFMYVKYPASQAVAVGNIVAINSTNGEATLLTSTNAAAGQTVGRRVGVAMGAVASSTSVQYGWAQTFGPGSCTAVAAIAVNTNLTSTATAGHLGAGGVAVTGVVLTAVGAGTTPVACTLNNPFVTG